MQRKKGTVTSLLQRTGWKEDKSSREVRGGAGEPLRASAPGGQRGSRLALPSRAPRLPSICAQKARKRKERRAGGRASARPPGTSCLRGERRKDRVRPARGGSASPPSPLHAKEGGQASERRLMRGWPGAGTSVQRDPADTAFSFRPCCPRWWCGGGARAEACVVTSGAPRARGRAPGSPRGSMRSRRALGSLQRHKHGDLPA